MSDIQCPNCGKLVAARFTQCPYCREDLTPRVVFSQRGSSGGAEIGTRWIRRGLLYMLLAGVSYYLLGGHSPIPLTIPEIPDWVVNYALPFLFLAGLGLMVAGFVRRSLG